MGAPLCSGMLGLCPDPNWCPEPVKWQSLGLGWGTSTRDTALSPSPLNALCKVRCRAAGGVCLCPVIGVALFAGNLGLQQGTWKFPGLSACVSFLSIFRAAWAHRVMLCGLLQGLPKLGVPQLGSVAARSRFLGKSGGQRRGWGLGPASPLFSASCFSPSSCDSPSLAGFLGQEENCSLKSGASKFRKQDTGLGCGRGLGGLRGMWQHPSGWVGGRNGHSAAPSATRCSFFISLGKSFNFPLPSSSQTTACPLACCCPAKGGWPLAFPLFHGLLGKCWGRAAGLCHLCVPPGSSASTSLPRTKSLGFFWYFFFFWWGKGELLMSLERLPWEPVANESLGFPFHLEFPGNSVPMATSVTDTPAGSRATAADGQKKGRKSSWLCWPGGSVPFG